ncbi:MAG: HAD family hydrolase, partial [Corynebacterium casei]|nr:HAD family hydrolase [Corynebacterium casei]
RTGIMTDAAISRYPFRPTRVLDSVADIPERLMDPFA